MKKLVLFLLLTLPLLLRAQTFIFSDNFTTNKGLTNNPLTGYTNWDETCCAWSFGISDSAANSIFNSGRFELRKTDPSPQPNDSKRSQMEWNGFAVPMGATWYAMSIMLAPWAGNDPAPEDLMDLHDRMPGGASSNWTNPWGIWNKNGRWTCHITYDTVNMATDQGAHIVNQEFDLGAVQPGVWVNWVLHTNYTPRRDTGYVEVYKNGVKVIDYHGPCAYQGAMPDPYYKFGIYKWPWDIPNFSPASTQTLRVFYVDDLKIGGRSNVLSDFVSGAPANQLPHANAGGNKNIQLPQHEVTLSGTASTDADGTITSYAWSRISGPNTPAIATPNAVTTTVGHHVSGADTLIQGTYVYKLVVTDNSGGKDSQNVQIVVNAAANISPIANAGTDASTDANSWTLNGTLSNDIDGNITAYSWTQLAGPNTATRVSPTAASCPITGLIIGVYTFKLTVTDNNSATGVDTVNITITPTTNVDPVAIAPSTQDGNNRTVFPINTAVLNGSRSYDPDGNITQYVWSQLSGPNTATLTHADSSYCIASGLTIGVYKFRLTVTDNRGSQNSTDFFYYVNPFLKRTSVSSN